MGMYISGMGNPIMNNRGSSSGVMVTSLRKYHVSICVSNVNEP